MYNILLADDHKIVRYGMKLIIEDDPIFNLIGEASDGDEALLLMKLNRCDLIVLDLHMPIRDGFSVLDEISKNFHSTKTLVMSVSTEPSTVKKVLSYNVDGFLNKNEDLKVISDAVHTILEGKKYFSREIQDVVMSNFGSMMHKNKAESRMTGREQEVLVNIRLGLSNKEISEKMGISVHTVQFHRSNIIKKFNLKNSAELIRFAMESEI